MNDLQPQGNSDWLSLEEVATQNGVTISAVSHSLSIHSAIKLKHFKRIGKKGYLTKEGAALLKFRKSMAGKTKKPSVEFELNEAPVKEQDIIAVGMSELMNDPFIQMRMKQLQIEKVQAIQGQRIEAIEEKLQVTARLLEDTDPVDITTAQREFLNERVRNLSFKSGLPFGRIWGLVHDQVGKRPIETYTFQDYPVAIKFLKKVYAQNGLSW